MAYVFDYMAILSGESWWGFEAPARPVILTYSFENSAQPYLADSGYSAPYIESFQAFTAPEQDLARQALLQWDAVAGVYFVEGPAGQGDVRFAKYNFAFDEPGMNEFGAYAYYPYAEIGQDAGWEDAIGGDVFINTTYPMTLGLLLHELGHALGLEHPFDADPYLHPSVDDSAHTVMSYEGPDPTILGPFDIEAIRSLYGLQGKESTFLAGVAWDAATFTLTQIGTPQGDSIRGVSAADVMSGEGGNDILFGSFGNDRLDGGPGEDSLFGGAGDDRLVGGPGDDLIDGRTGLDEVEDGAETVDYSGAAQPVTVDLLGIGGGPFEAQGADTGSDRLANIDNIVGGAGNDTLAANAGDNLLTGGAGDDALDGRGGGDRATFTAARTQYDVRTVWLGGALATHVTHAGGDGGDTLRNIEELQFADLSADLAGAQLNRAANIAGSRFDDVLFQNAADGQVLFARMVDGVFQDWGVATAALGDDFVAVATGNVNPAPTGGAELFIQQQSSGAIYYASQDTGALTWGVVSAALTGQWKLRAVADVNGDASADAIVQNADTGSICYADMRGGVFQGWRVVSEALTGEWIAVGAGDIDGDGFADVVIQNAADGTALWAGMANGAFGGWNVVTRSLSPDWRVKAVADVTGDSRADVVFQNAAGGDGFEPGTTLYGDLGSGTTAYGIVTRHIDASWEAAGTADVDNDGFADVLFRHATDGTTLYAGMGAGGFEAWGAVSTAVTDGWHVV